MATSPISKNLLGCVVRGEQAVVIESATAQQIAYMLEYAWIFGTPEIRDYFCNHDQGFAERLIRERNDGNLPPRT